MVEVAAGQLADTPHLGLEFPGQLPAQLRVEWRSTLGPAVGSQNRASQAMDEWEAAEPADSPTERVQGLVDQALQQEAAGRLVHVHAAEFRRPIDVDTQQLEDSAGHGRR